MDDLSILSRLNNNDMFRFRWLRHGFLVFFQSMFGNMLFSTYLVFAEERPLGQAVTLLWIFRLPWRWAYHGTAFAPWAAQFAFGFYSVMLTCTVLGAVTMACFPAKDVVCLVLWGR